MTNILFHLLEQEKARQDVNIELIASENFVSKEVMALLGSELTNKYAEGYPGRRYYGGCEVVDKIELFAQEQGLSLFNLEHDEWSVNVQPHSGSQANMAAYLGIFKEMGFSYNTPILAMNLNAGGHLTHGSRASDTGSRFNFAHYGVDKEGFIDYDKLEEMATEVKPGIIVAGASAYSREIKFDRFRRIADKVGAVLMVDMAHIAGLVATGEHMSPFRYADVVTSTTHKTLRGPRGGVIFMKNRFAKTINSAIFPGTQGGPLMNVIAAKAQCFIEAHDIHFSMYIMDTKECARRLADHFTKDGLDVVSGGTDNHMFILNTLTSYGLTGKEAQELLDKSGITTNKNSVPDETLSPFVTSGIRIGTAAIASQGFSPHNMRMLHSIIHECLSERKNVSGKVLMLKNHVMGVY